MGDALLSAVDQNGDGRLGLREIRSVGERLQSADVSGDGAIAKEEIPVTIRFAVARSTYITQAFGYGRGAYGGFSGGAFGGPGAPAAGDQDGPRWFFHMDTNGDGDITRREFLGSAEHFSALDANGDGFIEKQEAQPRPVQPQAAN
jgi:Ca2+-binding EF-hand superfamily protein